MKVNTLQMKRAVSAVLFVLLLSAVGMTKAFAQSFTMGYLNYSVNDDGTTVTVNGHVDGTEATGELVIPEMVTYNELTYSVTTIGEWAFGACFGFNGNLVIPNSVTTISDCAFCYCNGFTGNLVIPKSVTTIGGSAFYYCSGFNGNLVIPNSVTYIGGDAFSECAFSSVEYNVTDCADISWSAFFYCTGQLIIGENVERIPANMFQFVAFSLILSHAEVPPIVGDGAFHSIDQFIPVYVPCGSLSDYQNAEGWYVFNNIFECCEVKEITAVAAPANSGTVTGMGTYEMGTTCTLTAIANEGYTFLYWTEDETVVSTDATFSFVVIEDRNLVANFRLPGVLGDANNDHVVNVADVQAVAAYLYEYNLPIFNVSNADANLDGVIDIGDIQAILMIIQNNYPDN